MDRHEPAAPRAGRWIRRPTEWSVRARLLLLVLSVALPTTLALGLAALDAWRNARERTATLLRARTEAVAATIGHELDLTRMMLQTLATSPTLAAGDLEAFRHQLDRLPHSPELRLVLTDAEGRVLVNSRFARGTPLPPRGDLDAVGRAFATGEPQVSNLYVGPMTGDHLLAVDVPVRDAGGRVLYNLSAGLQAGSFRRVLDEQHLPGSWRASIVDGNGMIVARTHGTGVFTGRPVAHSSLEAIRRGENPFDTVSQEGLAVRGVHAPIPGTPWTAVVVVPRAEMLAPLRDALLAALATSGGLLLLGLAGALWQGRRLAVAFSALAEGAAALGRGTAPLPRPGGVTEARRVGEALSRAAAALAEREAERAAADRRQALLINELNHRVKNTLATVQAIADQTLRRGAAGLEKPFADLDQRLRALARAHDLLVAGTWGDTPLPRVVEAALAPWTEAGRTTVTCLCGAPFPRLSPSQAQALVLALHELATNAAKYGALSGPAGTVAVSCRIEAAARG